MSTCKICNKKVSIVNTITNICKCNNLFCNNHKLPENHACSFDYLLKNSKDIEKNNQKMLANKVINF
jgi:predicted nucleic acid binding AN1-type Zn finger protein